MTGQHDRRVELLASQDAILAGLCLLTGRNILSLGYNSVRHWRLRACIHGVGDPGLVG